MRDRCPLQDRSRGQYFSVVGWPEALLTFLLLFGVGLIFFSPLLEGQTFAPSDILFEAYPWFDLRPNSDPQNIYLSDVIDYYLPALKYGCDSIAGGRFPLWNPYIAGGVPFGTLVSNPILYPLNALLCVLPFGEALGWHALLRLTIAGWLMYSFLRRRRLHPFAAWLGGIAYAYNGFHIVWLGWPHVFASIWLPGLLLGVDLALSQPGNRWGYPVLAGSWLLCVLGGFPAIAVYGGYMAGVYALFLLMRNLYAARRGSRWQVAWKTAGLQAAGLVSSITAGTLITLPLLLSLREALVFSGYGSFRVASNLSSRHLGLAHLVRLLYPFYFGDLQSHTYWANAHYIESSWYVGVVIVLLACVGTLAGRDRWIRGCLITILGFGITVVFGISPMFHLLTRMPLMNLSNNTRLLSVVTLMIIALAAYGFDALLRQQIRGGAILAATLLFGVMLILPLVMPNLVDEAGNIRVGTVRVTWMVHLMSRDTALRLHAWAQTGYFFVASLRVVVLGVIGLVMIAWLYLSPKCQWVQYSLGILVLVVLVYDLFGAQRGFNPFQNEPEVFPEHPAITYLRSVPELARVAGQGFTLYPNTAMVYGLFDVRGHDMFHWYRWNDLLNAISPDTALYTRDRHLLFGRHNAADMNWDSPLLDLLNVCYVLSSANATEFPTDYREVFREGHVIVYRNDSCMPRVFAPARLHMGTPEQILAAMSRLEFDPWQEGWVEDSSVYAQFSDLNGQLGQLDARIVSYEPERVIIEAWASAPTLLILSDGYYPGWQVLVDDKPSRIVVADYALRGVAINSGYHRVEFVYRPKSFYYSLVGTGAGVFLVSLLIAVAWRPDWGAYFEKSHRERL